MKSYILRLTISIAALLSLSVYIFANDEQISVDKSIYVNGPEIITMEKIYNFKPVLEETLVEHTFSIANNGDAPLHIEQADAGCGCTAVDFTEWIEPGSTGHLTVKADTKGYGGQNFSESVTIKTNDPVRRVVEFSFFGKVNKFAEISPKRAVLKGVSGKLLKTEINITPNEKYPFQIRTVKADSTINSLVSFKLEKMPKGYKLLLSFISSKPEKKFGKIYLSTDSNIRPKLIIPIFLDVRGKG